MDVRSKIIDHVLSSLSDLDSHILNQIGLVYTYLFTSCMIKSKRR